MDRLTIAIKTLEWTEGGYSNPVFQVYHIDVRADNNAVIAFGGLAMFGQYAANSTCRLSVAAKKRTVSCKRGYEGLRDITFAVIASLRVKSVRFEEGITNHGMNACSTHIL